MVRFNLHPAVSAFIIASAIAVPARAQQAPTGSWAAEASGAYFYEGAAATDGTYLYLVGGYQYGTYPQNGFDWAVCRRYDPAANSWMTIAQTPIWLNRYNSAAYYNGRIFSFSGGNSNGIIYAYTLSTNTWATLSATLSNPRYYTAAATLGNKIYIAGGFWGTASALCDEFDPATDTITPRASMPGGRVHHSMAAVPSLGKIYVMGGFFFQGGGAAGWPLDTCYEFTPPSVGSPNGSWVTKTPMNVGGVSAPRSLNPAAFAVNNRVYVAGGHSAALASLGFPYNTTLEYNPATDKWAQRASMSAYRFATAGAAINGKGYVYGGPVEPTSCEEYTPPDFGAPPAAATVIQTGSRNETSLQAAPDPSKFDGWTNDHVTFSADVTDPDAGQQVRLRVRVKPSGSQGWTELDTGLQGQGTLALPWTISAAGAYDWEYRIEDDLDNGDPAVYGTWAPAFNNANSPDFRSDQVPPSAPVGAGPNGYDVQATDPAAGSVTFSWSPSTDDGPIASIEYEIQATPDGAFNDIEAQFFSAPGAGETPATLAPSDAPKYWRVRARDLGANLSPWSSPMTFRLVHDGGGGGGGRCGQSASTPPGSVAAMAVGLALLGLSVRRR